MMATKENIPYSMMGFVFEKLVPSLLPTDDQIRPRYFLSSSRFILVLLTLNMKSGPQLQFHDFFFLFGLIIYPFSGAVSLSPALKSAAKQLLELILCLTFRWYWTGVLNWKYNRHCSLFQKSYRVSGFFRYWRAKDCNKVFTRWKSCAMEGS